MMSCTLFLWMRVPSIVEKYKSAVLISGLVTFIAAYHYIRIFNSWVDGYRYPAVTNEDMYGGHGDRAEPGRPILSGYKGELVLTGDLTPRWISWLISMSFFLFIVQTLLVGLPDDGDLGAEQRGRDPARVLLLGHHLEVRGGAADLPDHEREVKEHAGGRPRQVSKAGKGFKAYVPAMTQEAYEEEGVLFRTVASWQLRALCSVPLIFVVAVGWSLCWFPFMVVVCRLCMAVAGAAPIISPSPLHSDRAHCLFCLLLSSVFSDTLPSPTQCTHDGGGGVRV